MSTKSTSPQSNVPSVVPITILSGFLGSGKTSLLNHLLHNPGDRKITALINDFGSLNIDAEIIARQHGAQIELANGCICCSLGDDLGESLAELLNQPTLPDCLVIEASGIADPLRIAAYASIDRQLRLDGILCCIDVSQFQRQLCDPRLSDTLARQINSAHLFAMTKPDLLADDASLDDIAHYLSTQRAQAPQIAVGHGVIDPDLVLGPVLASAMSSTAPASAHTPISEDTRHDHFVQWTGHLPPLPPERLEAMIRALGPDLLRAKGFGSDESGAYIFHYVGGAWSIERMAPQTGTPTQKREAEEGPTNAASPTASTAASNGGASPLSTSPHRHCVLIGFRGLSLAGSAFADYQAAAK